jgi:hypothetical protein
METKETREKLKIARAGGEGSSVRFAMNFKE